MPMTLPVVSAAWPDPAPRPGGPGTTNERLGRALPGHGRRAVRARPRRRLPAAGGHHPVGPVHRRAGQPDHAGAVRPLSRPESLAAADLSEVEALDPADRVLPGQDAQPDGHGRRRWSNGSTARCRSAMEDLVTLPGVGRKTANVVRSVAFGLPGPARRHPCAAPVPPARAHRRDRPGQGGAGAERLVPAGRAGGVQPAPDPARAGHLCTARSPRCERCVLADFCPSATVGRSGRPTGVVA